MSCNNSLSSRATGISCLLTDADVKRCLLGKSVVQTAMCPEYIMLIMSVVDCVSLCCRCTIVLKCASSKTCKQQHQNPCKIKSPFHSNQRVVLVGGSFRYLVFTNLLTLLRDHVQWLTCIVEVCLSTLCDVDTKIV